MKNLLDERYLDALGAQLIVEDTTNHKTYVCCLDRSKYDSSLTQGDKIFATSELETEIAMIVAKTATTITVNDGSATVYTRDSENDTETAFAWKDTNNVVVFTASATPVAALNIEQQNCWQIKRITDTVNGTKNETRIEYPNGSSKFVFAASQASSYSYEYLI